MRRAFSALSFVSLLTLTAGCDSEQEDAGDAFRAFDINIQMTMADGGNDDGTVIWDVLETKVYEGEAASGDLLLYISGNIIYDTEGVKTCEVNNPFLNSTLYEVIAANGTDVLFTVWGNYVFDGEIDPNQENFGQIKKLFGDQLLFQYEINDIFLGEAREGYRLMTTNVDTTTLSDGHKLLMAALMTGECGSAGLPGYPGL